MARQRCPTSDSEAATRSPVDIPSFIPKAMTRRSQSQRLDSISMSAWRPRRAAALSPSLRPSMRRAPGRHCGRDDGQGPAPACGGARPTARTRVAILKIGSGKARSSRRTWRTLAHCTIAPRPASLTGNMRRTHGILLAHRPLSPQRVWPTSSMPRLATDETRRRLRRGSSLRRWLRRNIGAPLGDHTCRSRGQYELAGPSPCPFARGALS